MVDDELGVVDDELGVVDDELGVVDDELGVVDDELGVVAVKIVVKGDRNVGKSCLFYRLQGQKFKEEYLPTDEIQVSLV